MHWRSQFATCIRQLRCCGSRRLHDSRELPVKSLLVMKQLFTLLLVICCSAIVTEAQTADPNPLTNSVSVPTVTFSLSWKDGNPNWYSVAIQQMGRASYTSTSAAGEGAPDRYMVEFTASEQTRKKVFDLAKDAGYFQGDFDFKKGRIAQTGAKTLVYQDQNRRTQTTFNWSQNRAIQQLSDLFQAISTTVEFGRKLEHNYRFEKLGLDRDLKRMEDLKQSNQLLEVQANEPILKRIAEDKTVVNVSRQRALRLMGMSDAPARSALIGR
jgi:hypothetical protein